MSVLVQNVAKENMKVKLNLSSCITFKELTDITDAFQISSGQSFAIGSTKALIEFIKEKNILIITNYLESNAEYKVSTIRELANIYNQIDPSIDLLNDKGFDEYFL